MSGRGKGLGLLLWLGSKHSVRGQSFILWAHTANSPELTTQKLEPAEREFLTGGTTWTVPSVLRTLGSWQPSVQALVIPGPQLPHYNVLQSFTKQKGQRDSDILDLIRHFEDGETEAHGGFVLPQVQQPMSHDMETQTQVTCSESGLSFLLNLFFHHKRKEDCCSSKTRAYIQKKTIL